MVSEELRRCRPPVAQPLDPERWSSLTGPDSIAITGLGSFFGQRLVERLLEREPRVRIVGLDLRRPLRLEGRVSFHRVDLTDPTADTRLADVFAKESVQVVVHTAFRTQPTPDLEYDHELETIGSLHVMNACAAAKVKRLVVASSTTLYGPRPDNPNFLTEEHPLRGHPDAHTVCNRVEAEQLLADWSVRHPDAEVSVLRPCWIMGATYWDQVVRYFSRPVVPTLIGYDPLLQFVIHISKYIQNKKGLSLSISDIKGASFLKKANKYFQHVIKFSLFTDKQQKTDSTC